MWMRTLWNFQLKFFLSSHRGRDKKLPSLLPPSLLTPFFVMLMPEQAMNNNPVYLEKAAHWKTFFDRAWFVLQNLGIMLSFLVCYLLGHYLLTMFRGTLLYSIFLMFVNCGLREMYTQETVWRRKGEGNLSVFLNSSHPINKLWPVKRHQPQLCLCIPANSQEVFSQGSTITRRSWPLTNTGGWMSVSPTEPTRRF